MISPDITLETRFLYAPFLIENNVKAVTHVVIIGEEGKQLFGGILQVDSHTPREFSIEDTAFLRTYANLIAATPAQPSRAISSRLGFNRRETR
jgi:hypothetical protein